MRSVSKNEARTRYPHETTTKSNMPRIQRKDDGSSPAKKDKKSAKPEPKKRKSRPDDDDSSVDGRGHIIVKNSYSDEEASVSSNYPMNQAARSRRLQSAVMQHDVRRSQNLKRSQSQSQKYRLHLLVANHARRLSRLLKKFVRRKKRAAIGKRKQGRLRPKRTMMTMMKILSRLLSKMIRKMNMKMILGNSMKRKMN